MCGETRLRVCFGPLHQGPRNSPLFLHTYSPQGTVQTLGFVQIKSLPQLQLHVLRLCSTTRQRRHRIPPSLIKLSSYIRNIQIAISVSCLFFVCSQEIDPRGQVDRAPAWSITPRKLVQRLLRRDVSHVRSRIVKVDSHRKRQPPSHRNIGTPQPLSSGIRFPGCSVRFYSFSQIRSSLFFIPIVHEKAKKIGLVHHIRTNLSLCIIFLGFLLC